MNQFLVFAPGHAASRIAAPRGALWDPTNRTGAETARPLTLSLPVLGACLVSRHGRHGMVLTPPDDTPMVVVAPAAAVVVHSAECGPTEFGSHIVLRLADGSHLTLARFAPDSLLVRVGQTVAPGDPIARFGPAPMLLRRHAKADPAGRSSPVHLAPHAEHGNGGPRWTAGGRPGRQSALRQPLWPMPDEPALRLAPRAAVWVIDPVGAAALRFVRGRDPAALVADCLGLSFAVPPPAWLVGLWWRHDIVRGPAWRRVLARLWPSLRARSFATIVSGDANARQLRVRVEGSGGNLPQLMQMEFDRDGLRWLHAEFADGVLAARRIGQPPGQGSTHNPGQTNSQRRTLAA